MALSIGTFINTRPWLFHLTSQQNVARIQRMKRLASAASLLRQAGMRDYLGVRRTDMLPIEIDGEDVYIRDQMPLRENAMALTDGCNLAEYVEYLNNHVFLWPGKEDGPACISGKNHFGRYEDENPSVIRIDTAALFNCNPQNPPLFSNCNSGSARYHNGRKAPRHRRMFVVADDFQRTPSKVIEVTFKDEVVFPSSGVHVKRLKSTTWKLLFKC